MVDQITSCKKLYERALKSQFPSKKQTGKHTTTGEISTQNDYEIFGFHGYDNIHRDPASTKKWAEDTRNLALYSTYCHLGEIPLKILSYIVRTDDEDSFISKVFFAAERLIDSLGGMFRNQIYAHEVPGKEGTSKGDDDIAAEKLAKEKFGDSTTYYLTLANHHVQTKGRFLVPLLGLISPQTANTLDWIVGGTLDSIRWKRAASNSAFYPGFLHDVGNNIYYKCRKLFTNDSAGLNKAIEPIWSTIKESFKKHYNAAKTSLTSLSSGNLSKDEQYTGRLSFYKEMDKLTSAFLSFSQWPNMIGDILRPLGRVIGLEGFPRNLFRILSIIDRPFIWANYLYRFYLPQRLQERNNNQSNNNGIVNQSNLFPVAIAGDMIDFVSTIFEDKVKESSKWVQDPIEMVRIIKSSAFKLFFSGRRIRTAERALKLSQEQKK